MNAVLINFKQCYVITGNCGIRTHDLPFESSLPENTRTLASTILNKVVFCFQIVIPTNGFCQKILLIFRSHFLSTLMTTMKMELKMQRLIVLFCSWCWCCCCTSRCCCMETQITGLLIAFVVVAGCFYGVSLLHQLFPKI